MTARQSHMADADFTPGPWRIDDRRAAGGSLQVQAKHRGEGSSYCVATVNFWEVPEANARLIAAAPELYQVVTDLLGYPSVRAAIGDKFEAHALSILAKARGEQVVA